MIRPIAADDGPRLRAAYDRLSSESKYRRFLAPKPHLTNSAGGGKSRCSCETDSMFAMRYSFVCSAEIVLTFTTQRQPAECLRLIGGFAGRLEL